MRLVRIAVDMIMFLKFLEQGETFTTMVKEGLPGAGVPLVKVMEYIDRRADFKRQGIAAEETARLCVQAIKELKMKGYKLYDAPEVVDVNSAT